MTLNSIYIQNYEVFVHDRGIRIHRFIEIIQIILLGYINIFQVWTLPNTVSITIWLVFNLNFKLWTGNNNIIMSFTTDYTGITKLRVVIYKCFTIV